MIRFGYIFCWPFVLLLSACAAIPLTTSLPLPNGKIPAIGTPVGTKMISVSTTTTASPSGTKRLCLEPAYDIPPELKLDGVLLLEDNAKSNLFLLDLATHQKSQLSTQPAYGIVFSPDKSFVYYLECNGKCAGIAASRNGVVKTIPDVSAWRIVNWLDDEYLIINHDNEPANSIIVLDTFNGRKRIFPLGLPDPYYAYTLDNTRVLITTLDRTLTRAVYFDTQGIGRVILWDIIRGRELAWLPYPIPKDSKDLLVGPEFFSGWSPDGSQYVIALPVPYSNTAPDRSTAEELFGFGREGQITQLTDLSSTFGYVHIYEYQWSPDGRYIAFWLKISTNKDASPTDVIQRLVVLDVATREMTEYCVSSGDRQFSSAISLPIWSPDSQQLVVQNRSENGKWLVTLVDFTQGIVVPIAEDLTLLGWLK
jgi:hypothetical protein